MDFKNVLEEWKNYQENKLVMANLFPCTVTLAHDCNFQGNLSFTGTGEGRSIQCYNSNFESTWTLLLSRIQGTSPDGSTIRFTLTGGQAIVIRFPSESLQRAAHEAFARFEREEFGLTPPSTSGSSGEED